MNDVMKKVRVPLPHDNAEQEAIAEILSDMDGEIAALEDKLAKARHIKQGMMQALLTGRIRLVTSIPNLAPLPMKTERAADSGKSHNWQINEAVVISVLTKHFGSEQFPLGRKRCTKLCYLLHRHVERKAEGFLKKAAGPYNPSIKYGGPERISLGKKYIRRHARDQFSGFVVGDNIAAAESYFRKWYGDEVIVWLEQFRFASNDELELLATVDMAMEDLRGEDKQVDLVGVKQVIADHPEWEAKLEREIFSDPNIIRAIRSCGELYEGKPEH